LKRLAGEPISSSCNRQRQGEQTDSALFYTCTSDSEKKILVHIFDVSEGATSENIFQTGKLLPALRLYDLYG